MQGRSTVEKLLDAETSGELKAILETIAETTIDGGAKFAPPVCRRLAREIVCRTYAGAVHELCHLVRAAEAAHGGRGYERFFWGGPATARDCRARMIEAVTDNRPPDGSVEIEHSGIRLAYSDGSFAIAFSRMPLLLALMEFLVSALGYAALDAAIRNEPGGEPGMAAVSRAANGVSRQVYAFLKAHLPTTQAQRKLHALTTFLRQRGGSATEPDDLDDDAVLAFWLLASRDDSEATDFRTFKATFQTFVRLHDALAVARDHDALDRPLSIGGDGDAGEVDPAEIEHAIAAIDERRAALEVLSAAPAAAIKFLTKTETASIALIMSCGEAAGVMPLSVLRCQVFGAVQSRITQASRRTAGAIDVDRVFRDGGVEGYSRQGEALHRIERHVALALHAAFHALARGRRGEAIEVLLGLRPGIELGPLAPLFVTPGDGPSNVVPLTAPAIGARFLATVEEDAARCPELAAFVADAKRAFRRISRQGFDEAGLDDSAVIDGFAAARDALFSIADRLQRFRRRLARRAPPAGDWECQFDADRVVFTEQFRVIYGEVR